MVINIITHKLVINRSGDWNNQDVTCLHIWVSVGMCSDSKRVRNNVCVCTSVREKKGKGNVLLYLCVCLCGHLIKTIVWTNLAAQRVFRECLSIAFFWVKAVRTTRGQKLKENQSQLHIKAVYFPLIIIWAQNKMNGCCSQGTLCQGPGLLLFGSRPPFNTSSHNTLQHAHSALDSFIFLFFAQKGEGFCHFITRSCCVLPASLWLTSFLLHIRLLLWLGENKKYITYTYNESVKKEKRKQTRKYVHKTKKLLSTSC